MKEYSISKWAFRGICVLIIILPVSRHWRLLTGGDHAMGTVTGFVMHAEDNLVGESEVFYASEVSFQVDGREHKAHGPANYEYKTGRKIRVFYDPGEPSQSCLFTFSAFYLDNYTVLPIILLVVWAAFYLSFNNYRRKQRFKKMNYPREESPQGNQPDQPSLESRDAASESRKIRVFL